MITTPCYVPIARLLMQVTALDTIMQILNQFFAALGNAFSQFSLPEGAGAAFGAAGTLLLHILCAALALIIVLRCVSSLLRGRVEEESWGFFSMPNGARLPLNHWENINGRAAS